MAPDHKTARALYKRLLALYPQGFRDRLGESMEQTFDDLWREHRATRGGTFGFMLRTFAETSVGIIRENLAYDTMATLTTNPKLAALIGFLFILPFVVMNAIVGNRIEPFFSFIRPGIHTSPLEYVLLPVLLLLILAGSFIAARPMLLPGADGRRKFYAVNGVVSALLFVVFAVLAVALASEIYRCDILRIPNCD
jgi:hypothetical protein